MGWPEKLPSGRYRGMYRDAWGKQRSAGTFTHKAAAVRAANVKEDEARKSLARNPDAHKQTWGEWCEVWWDTRLVDDGTLKRDKSRLDKHLTPKWAQVPLGQITRHDIVSWVADLQRPDEVGKRRAASTVQRIVHLLSASLSAAVDAEILVANPAARIKLPPAAPNKERYLTIEEFNLVMAQLPTRRDRIIMATLAYSGIRIGELSGLHRHRLDLKRRTLSVAEVFDEEMGDIKAYPKGKRMRTVPLPEWLCIELGWLVSQNTASRTCGLEHRTGTCRSGLVFTIETGSVVWRSNWDTIYRNAIKAVNLGTEEKPVPMEPATIHDLRHTYASWMLQDGTVSIAELSRLLGHTSITTTMRYSHLAPQDDERMLSALPAPRLPYEEVTPLAPKQRHAGSDAVGPVGLEPTTRGLKVRLPAESN